jgi:hypothetical protein
MLDDMDALPAWAIQDKPTTIVFWLKPYDSTYMNILPRFRSRAHFVDKVVYIYAQNSCIPEDNHPSTQDMLFSASYIWQQIFQRSAYLRQSYHWILPFLVESQTKWLLAMAQHLEKASLDGSLWAWNSYDPDLEFDMTYMTFANMMCWAAT